MTRSSATAGSQRFRVRKISNRQSLRIVREKEVDLETPAEGQKIETGVEATEEEVRIFSPFPPPGRCRLRP
jgi:hypothetical protein